MPGFAWWHRPFRSIRGLAILFASITAMVTVILGGITFMIVHREIERQIDQRIDAETEALLDYDREHGFDALAKVVAARDKRAVPGRIGYLEALEQRDNREMGYMLLDPSGRRIAGSLNARIPPPGWSEFLSFTRQDGSRSEAQVINSTLSNGGRLIVAGDRATVHAMDRMLINLFAAAFASVLVLGAIMVTLFGRTIRGRLVGIEHAAHSIISGDMLERIPLDGTGDELDRLSLLLNRMLDRINKLMDNLRAVSNGLAHDLRTPLSRLIAKLEEAAELSDNPQQQSLLDASLAEIDELLELFAGLLALAEIDRQTVRGRFVPLDLASAVSDIAEVHRASIEDAGMALDIHVEPTIVFGDRTLLQRLVGNLMDNVLNHAPSATTVTISVASRHDRAVVRVQDDGAGIPETERERIFERFVRLDASRSSPGHGLGLSIVSAIGAVHGGEVRVLPSETGMIVEFAMQLHGVVKRTHQ